MMSSEVQFPHTRKEDIAMECTLGMGDLLSLKGGSKGLMLHCLQGTIWLTQGDGVDYLIHQGHHFDLGPEATAVIEALGLAEFRLETAACRCAVIESILMREAQVIQ
jgi:hypothetical protein